MLSICAHLNILQEDGLLSYGMQCLFCLGREVHCKALNLKTAPKPGFLCEISVSHRSNMSCRKKVRLGVRCAGYSSQRWILRFDPPKLIILRSLSQSTQTGCRLFLNEEKKGRVFLNWTKSMQKSHSLGERDPEGRESCECEDLH